MGPEGEAKYWTKAWRSSHKIRRTLVHLRIEQEPIVVDFEVVGLHRDTRLFRFYWDGEGSVLLEKHTPGADTPPEVEVFAQGVSSAHAGYIQVEDRLDTGSFWDEQERRLGNHEGGGG